MKKNKTTQVFYDTALTVFTKKGALSRLEKGVETLENVVPAIYTRWQTDLKTQQGKTFADTCTELAAKVNVDQATPDLSLLSTRTAAFFYSLDKK